MFDRRFFFLIAVFAIVGTAIAQQNRPKVAIKTFQNPSVAPRSTIGNGLTEILTTELQNTGKFNVLERGNIDELTKEMDFANSEYSKGSTFAQKGNILGAQYLLMGKVTNFSYQEQAAQQQKKGLFNLPTNQLERVFKQQASVRVDFRLVDVATGETVISQAGEDTETNTSTVSELRIFYGYLNGTASITAEGTSSMIGRATAAAIKDVVRKLNALSETVRDRGVETARSANLGALEASKGQIAAEEGGGLWIVSGIGSSNGIMKGDQLRLVHETAVKDKTGKVVYRKPAEIGKMEVTDVSQPDHAEARVLAGGTGTPQVNDLVTIDMDRARALRGATASAVPSSSAPAADTSASAAQIEPMLKRGDNYMRDRFWAQALDEYRKAAAIAPNDARVLQGAAIAHYMAGDFVEGDESADKLLQLGAPLVVPVAHYHSMGVCTGQLTIQKGKLAFTSINNRDESFEAPQASIDLRKIAGGFVANEKLPAWLVMTVQARDSSGKDKKYQFIPYGYAKQQNLAGKNLASAFPMDDADVNQMQKLEQSVVTLANKYAR